MSNYWSKQIVLVTGGSGGVGREIVRHFHALGCKVAINYRTQMDRAESLKHELGGERVQTYRADVSVEAEVNAMIDQIENDFGPVTVLINNAGMLQSNLLITMTNDDWFGMINSHLTGTFFCTRRVLREMLKARAGRIINISSISGVKGFPGHAHYSAAKAGMIAFAKSVAFEVGKKGITCNAVILNQLKTENVVRVQPEVIEQLIESSPLRRLGEPHEVIPALEYLASDKSALMTGQVLTL